MSKLITAKEAVALSNSEANIDKHIERINAQIKWACQRHHNHASCLLDPCSNKEAVRIVAQLRAAGYCCKWESMLDDKMTWFFVSWEGN